MKAHRTDGLSLAFGLIFLAVVAWWLVAQVVDLSLPNAGWFVAGALILLGLLGLVGTLRNGRTREEAPGTDASDDTASLPAVGPPQAGDGPPQDTPAERE